MNIHIFDRWDEKPLNINSPISTINIKPILKLDTQRYNMSTITYYLTKTYQGKFTTKGNYLVRLKDKDYINELIGNKKDIIEFIRICLNDIGILKEKIGRTKNVR
jgi:hypothetical protein